MRCHNSDSFGIRVAVQHHCALFFYLHYFLYTLVYQKKSNEYCVRNWNQHILMIGFNFFFFLALLFVSILINADWYATFCFNRFTICWVECLFPFSQMPHHYGQYSKATQLYISVHVVYYCTIYRAISVLFWALLFTLVVIWNHIVIENSKLYLSSLNETLSRQIWNRGKSSCVIVQKNWGQGCPCIEYSFPNQVRHSPIALPLPSLYCSYWTCTMYMYFFRIYIWTIINWLPCSIIYYWGISMFWFPVGNLFTWNFRSVSTEMYIKPRNNSTLYTPTGVIS